jgi:lipopolysaccharide transport system ATP-binding protein
MSDVVIKAENLSKCYLVGHQGRERSSYTALRDVIACGARTLVHKTTDFLVGRQIIHGDEIEEFWALKDVSFEVTCGEVLGIIGRNGAGKSTLLKILSRITEPSEGRVTIKGRVASLLEVGTGFHPELTGRENIYLNGAILGMTRAEVRRKFDAIVSFSEIERFLDTPVKRYSSGMYVRLAFAVAAHLESEILVVDEVLAVGDIEFQRKCLGKMETIGRSGRTVLFVSHNMTAIQTLCSRAIWLTQGRVAAEGTPEQCTSSYLSGQARSYGALQAARPLNDSLSLSALSVAPATIVSGAELEITLEIKAIKSNRIEHLAMLFHTSFQVRIAIIDLRPSGLPIKLEPGGRVVAKGRIPSTRFVEGIYSIGLHVATAEFAQDFHDLTNFEVHSKAPVSGFVPYPAQYRGVIELDATMELGHYEI